MYAAENKKVTFRFLVDLIQLVRNRKIIRKILVKFNRIVYFLFSTTLMYTNIEVDFQKKKSLQFSINLWKW